MLTEVEEVRRAFDELEALSEGGGAAAAGYADAFPELLELALALEAVR